MLTTTGRSCFTSGASEGMGPLWRTVAGVLEGGAAAWASAARIDWSDACRWKAETRGSATTAPNAPPARAINKAKRRCMKPPEERPAGSQQRARPCISGAERNRPQGKVKQSQEIATAFIIGRKLPP